MNASKENARHAREALDIIVNQHQPMILRDYPEQLNRIYSFITAAERKLPTEASYKREKQKSK